MNSGCRSGRPMCVGFGEQLTFQQVELPLPKRFRGFVHILDQRVVVEIFTNAGQIR